MTRMNPEITNGPTTDAQRQIMLLAIQSILSAREWDSDTCDEIATLMIVNGYPIADIDNNDATPEVPCPSETK